MLARSYGSDLCPRICLRARQVPHIEGITFNDASRTSPWRGSSTFDSERYVGKGDGRLDVLEDLP